MKHILIIIIILIYSFLIPDTLPIYDTDEYIIGKGDILKIIFLNPKYPDQVVTVNYEGYISSDTIRRLKIDDLPISKAKQKIENQLQNRFVNISIDLRVFISRKIEETKFYNEFKSKMMMAEKYFLDMEYETTLFTLHDLSVLMIEKLKHIYPDKYGEKALFLQFRNVKFSKEGKAPYKFYNIEGEIINHTQNTFQWVKCLIDFINENGKVINSIERYAISDNIIRPMESKSFLFKGALSPEAIDIKYKIIEYQIVE